MTNRLSSTLADIFAPYPTLSLELDEERKVYGQFRAMESSLVSCVDEKTQANRSQFEVLVLGYRSNPIAVVSLVVQTNMQRKKRNGEFGRVDLVIVADEFRGLGLGRLIVLCSLIHLLTQYAGRLYSISCLAAHPAIGTILEREGFRPWNREDHGFTHEEIKLDDLDTQTLLMSLVSHAESAAKKANYRLRQGGTRSNHDA